MGLTLAIVFAVLLFLSLLPFGVEFEGRNENFRARLIAAGLRWRLPKRITARMEAATAPRPTEEDAGTESTLERLNSLRKGGETLWRDFGWPEFKSIWKALRILGRSLRLRIHRLDVCVATHDPALTGIVYGSACATLATFQRRSRIRVYPDFERATPVVDYRIELSILPLISLIRFIRSLFVLPLRKIVRLFRTLDQQPRAEKVSQHV